MKRNWLAAIIVAVMALGCTGLGQTLQDVGDKVSGAADVVGGTVGGVVDEATDGDLGGTLENAIGGVGDLISGIGSLLGGAVRSAQDVVVEGAGAVVEAVVDGVEAAVDLVTPDSDPEGPAQ